MQPRRLRILLTEGSSTSARQTLYALGRVGHVLDICDPDPFFCLGRFSRYVRIVHRCPLFSADPLGYLDFLLRLLRRRRYDVLLPTHDQVFLLARFRDRFPAQVGLAVSSFPALMRVQGKAAFVRLLRELGLPHPATELVRVRNDLEKTSRFPCYLKLPYSTAGQGVWRVESPAQLRQVADTLEQAGYLDGRGEVLLQQPAPGALCVVQSVFSQGSLVAGHCYRARALGVGGSALARESIADPLVLDQVSKLGAHLDWHGALMLDYLHDPHNGQPAYIDANPRIGETLNATLSGINLCQHLVEVSLGRMGPVSIPAPRRGVRTHALMMALLTRALAGATRRQLLAELPRAWTRTGMYQASQDELTRAREDPLSLLPAVFLALRLLIRPQAAASMVASAVKHYSLDEKTINVLAASGTGKV